jgi:hypothetical protein
MNQNKADKFLFEHEKPNPKIEGHHSTPECLSQLLVSLLGINKDQGKIVRLELYFMKFLLTV